MKNSIKISGTQVRYVLVSVLGKLLFLDIREIWINRTTFWSYQVVSGESKWGYIRKIAPQIIIFSQVWFTVSVDGTKHFIKNVLSCHFTQRGSPDNLPKIHIQSTMYLFNFFFFLMGWSLLPNTLRPFKIYCAPPNLGITRTWILRLNFAQRPIFSSLSFFNEHEISDSGPVA